LFRACPLFGKSPRRSSGRRRSPHSWPVQTLLCRILPAPVNSLMGVIDYARPSGAPTASTSCARARWKKPGGPWSPRSATCARTGRSTWKPAALAPSSICACGALAFQPGGGADEGGALAFQPSVGVEAVGGVGDADLERGGVAVAGQEAPGGEGADQAGGTGGCSGWRR
jgi:hypothetical protein